MDILKAIRYAKLIVTIIIVIVVIMFFRKIADFFRWLITNPFGAIAWIFKGIFGGIFGGLFGGLFGGIGRGIGSIF